MKRNTFIVSFVLIAAAYLLGIATGHYRYFPFQLLFDIKSEVGIGKNDKRNTDTSSLRQVEISETKSTGIYLTYGQSNSVNHGQIGYEVKGEVYQFFNNGTYLYEYPALGGTGQGGSVWGMVGDKLIDEGVHDKVVFSNNGFQGRRIEELNSDPYITYLMNSYKQLLEKFGRVDAILFHQGEINHETKFGNENYYEDFEIFIRKLRDNGIGTPIYLSRASICNTQTDSTLINIQNEIIKDFEIVLKGPNTDLLHEKKYRLPDYCHFSMLGYEKFSDMWVESLKR